MIEKTLELSKKYELFLPLFYTIIATGLYSIAYCFLCGFYFFNENFTIDYITNPIPFSKTGLIFLGVILLCILTWIMFSCDEYIRANRLKSKFLYLFLIALPYIVIMLLLRLGIDIKIDKIEITYLLLFILIIQVTNDIMHGNFKDILNFMLSLLISIIIYALVNVISGDNWLESWYTIILLIITITINLFTSTPKTGEKSSIKIYPVLIFIVLYFITIFLSDDLIKQFFNRNINEYFIVMCGVYFFIELSFYLFGILLLRELSERFMLVDKFKLFLENKHKETIDRIDLKNKFLIFALIIFYMSSPYLAYFVGKNIGSAIDLEGLYSKISYNNKNEKGIVCASSGNTIYVSVKGELYIFNSNEYQVE